MSLFQAREWWSTWCGGAEEEFDVGCLCVANIDNDPDNLDVIIVGSLNGVLRIFTPKKEGFKAEDLMLELQMNFPIIQIEAGQFVSGTTNPHLCILHPRKLCVYSVTSIVGSIQHGHHYTINLIYEHKLEHTGANMTIGKFGGVNDKDFICIQSMDGVLTFYEQETFSFQAFLPDFLLPGPIKYIAETDSFLIGSYSRNLEAYKYQSIATSSISGGNSGKKLVPDWSKCLGEHLLDIKIVKTDPVVVQLLGERSLFTVNTSGNIITMKKFEYNPSCLLAYPRQDKPDVITSVICTHSSTLLVYQETLIWSAKLPHIPVACLTGHFEDLEGVIVTIDQYGHLYCSYLGTDPSLFVAPFVENRMSNFSELERELKQLNSYIKRYESGAGIKSAKEIPEDIVVYVDVPSELDKVSMCGEDEEKGEELVPIPSVTVEIIIECKTIKPVENITVNIAPKFPLICSMPEMIVPIVGNRGPTESFKVSIFTSAVALPNELEVPVTATYFTDGDAPRVLQTSFDLPLSLVSFGTPPVKQANYKLTIDTNKEPVNLAELFPEMVSDAVIPVPVLGIQYYGGPVVSILSSKQSNRYRLQADLFEAIWLILNQLISRLENHFRKKADGSKFRCVFQGPIPLPEYFELIDNHFEQRLCIENYKNILAQRANQFRVIQKRLLTRFKDKTPSPLVHLDTLLDGTYKQLLALGEEFENTQEVLLHSSNALSGGTRLINMLIKLWMDMSEEDFQILESCLTPLVMDCDDQGWEEVVTNNVSFILRTKLAKSVKEQTSILTTIKMEKDTSKLKKQIALMCERLNKGASLSNASNASHETEKSKEILSSISENIETSHTLGQRFAEADERMTDAVRVAMENVKLYSDNPGIEPPSV